MGALDRSNPSDGFNTAANIPAAGFAVPTPAPQAEPFYPTPAAPAPPAAPESGVGAYPDSAKQAPGYPQQPEYPVEHSYGAQPPLPRASWTAKFGKQSQLCKCPTCEQDIVTRVDHGKTKRWWSAATVMVSGIVAASLFFWPCCCIGPPLAGATLASTDTGLHARRHLCPNCGAKVNSKKNVQIIKGKLDSTASQSDTAMAA